MMKLVPSEVVIRSALPGDQRALAALAVLDEAPLPAGPLLVAVVSNQLWAAVSLESREAIADPFVPSAAIVALVQMRADQLLGLPSPSRWRRWRRRPRSAPANRAQPSMKPA